MCKVDTSTKKQNVLKNHHIITDFRSLKNSNVSTLAKENLVYNHVMVISPEVHRNLTEYVNNHGPQYFPNYDQKLYNTYYYTPCNTHSVKEMR